MNPELLDGFVPMRVWWDAGTPTVDWCRLDGLRFTDPFFEGTIRRALQHPFNLAFRPQTPLGDLAARGAQRPGLAPSGFVFHLSRCGSTLVAQAFAALPHVLVISEAPPIDAVLRAHERDSRITDYERIVWLRAMIDALGQPRSRAERHLVVKFDAWHALHIDLIERAFPGVPWVFLVRDPVEVLVSHQRQISWMMAALNAPSLLECTPVEAMRLPRDEYHARVLARIATAMAAHGAAERTIDYRALPGAVWQTIAPHFGIALSSADDERLRAAVTRDAKQPTRAFTADAADKQDEADAELREYAARWLAEPYARLTDQNERGIPRTC